VSAPHEDEPWDASEPDDGFDELGRVLRDRFHQAVSTLEPGPGTLEYLRRAVPARRRRRHAALAATAVSVFAVSAGATLAARGSFDSGQSSTAGNTAIGNLLTTATDGAPGGGSGHGPASPGGQDMTSDGSLGTEQQSSASAPDTSKSAATTAPSALVSGSPQAPLCQNSTITELSAISTGTTEGVTYETFAGTAKTTCMLNGTPGLLVVKGGGGPAKVPVYKADSSAAPLLTQVPAVQALVLQPGERYEFQLAWAPLLCSSNSSPSAPPASGSPTGDSTSIAPTAGPTTTGGPTAASSSQPTPSGSQSSSVPSSSIYSVGYAVSGSQPAQSVSFRADCGATIYVTNYFPAPGQRSMANALAMDGAGG
jgi:hypothetical protein